MKVCPLVTQAVMLNEEDKSILVREADGDELEERAAHRHEEAASRAAGEEDEELFLNPDVDPSDPAIEDEYALDLAMGERVARIVAKDFRGQVNCLGAVCRFFDEGANTCRFESLLDSAKRDEASGGRSLEEIKADIEKMWSFQQESTGNILGMFKEQEQRIGGSSESLQRSFEQRVTELRELIASVIDKNDVIIESISDTLAEKVEEIEEKITTNERHIESFKTEVAGWKEALDRSLKTLETGLGENGRLIRDLSKNHTEIIAIVENQKRSLADEERKQQLAEAKRLNNAGVVAYHNGQYEKARDQFLKSIELNPAFTEAHNNLGLTYTEMGEEEKATEAFKKAIELNPNIAATYNNLGYAFYRLGSYAEAIEMYQEAIGRSKDNSAAYTNLGNAYYKLDRIDQAIEAWSTALTIDPANEKARRNLKRFNAEVRESR